MKTNMFKWARYLLIIVTVLTVASMFMPTQLLAAPSTTVNCENPGCNLLVNIVLPANKDEIAVGSTFWVNSIVAKPAGYTMISGVTATLTFSNSNISIVDCTATQGPVTLDSCSPTADFWWKVICNAEGNTDIIVNAASGTAAGAVVPRFAFCSADGAMTGSAQITVHQYLPPCNSCLAVTIIESPTAPVAPGTQFVVKAKICNTCATDVDHVYAWVDITGPAVLVSGSPNQIDIGEIQGNCCRDDVAFTLTCTGGGDVKVKISASEVERQQAVCAVSATASIHQICSAAGTVTITGVPAKVGTGCNPLYTLTANICDTCADTGMTDVYATLTITGNAVVASSNLQTDTVNVCPLIAGGQCKTVSWQIKCTGADPVGTPTSFVVVVHAKDAVSTLPITFTSPAVTTKQLDQIMVTMTSPAPNTKIDVCDNFDVTYRVTNVSTTNWAYPAYAGIGFGPNVALNGTTVDLVYCPNINKTTHPTIVSTWPGNGTPPAGWTNYVPIDCLCACCYVDVTWHLKCIGSDLTNCVAAPDVITGFAGVDGTPFMDDSATVNVIQMAKAHLEGTLYAYEGTLNAQTLEGCTPINAIAVGEDFTVVAAIENVGEACANNTTITLGMSGPATSSDNLTQTVGNICCHGSMKVIWNIHCTDQGPVTFKINTMTAVDSVNGKAVPADLGCPIIVDQICFKIDVIQPIHGEDFIVGDNFAIKARITNCDSDAVLNCAQAMLNWTGHLALNGSPQIMTLGGSDNKMLPGEVAEVAWNVTCTGAGDVTYSIVASNICAPLIDITSKSYTIHQWNPGYIGCEVVSPSLNSDSQCLSLNPYDAFVGTGETFVFTAKFFNLGGRPFTITAADLDVDGPGNVAIVSGPTPNPINMVLTAHSNTATTDEVTVSWTLRATKDGDARIEVHVAGHDDMCNTCMRECRHDANIEIYKAAYLTTAVKAAPTSVLVGADFQLTITVTNIGQADASNVKLTLAINPAGSASVTSGGLVQGPYSLYGHGNTANSQDVTWNLHCNAAGFTTFNITASGVDEYGTFVKQICTSEIDGPFQRTCCSLLLDSTPLTAIQNGSGVGVPNGALVVNNIENTSVTVSQGGNGGGGGGGGQQCASVTVNLVDGWNLFSAPYYADSETTGVDPATYFASISSNLKEVWYYSDCAPTGWTSWINGGPPSTLKIKDGQGYWLRMQGAATLTLTGLLNPNPPAVPPSYAVCTGWNQIGFKNGCMPRTVSDYLAGTSFTHGWQFVGGVWSPVVSDTLMQPGMGYWMYFTGPGTIAP
jgi:uncharacterized repeat protein (TIGR01451 family)